MNEKELKEYREFMSNSHNSHKCEVCPANEGKTHNTEWVLPCGQYNCWVDCHRTIKDD